MSIFNSRKTKKSVVQTGSSRILNFCMLAATLGIQAQAQAQALAETAAQATEAPTQILEIQLTGQPMISFAEVKSHLMKSIQSEASQNLSILQARSGLGSYFQNEEQTIRLKINSACYVLEGCSLKIAVKQGQDEVSSKISFERIKDEAQQSSAVREKIFSLSNSLLKLLLAQKR